MTYLERVFKIKNELINLNEKQLLCIYKDQELDFIYNIELLNEKDMILYSEIYLLVKVMTVLKEFIKINRDVLLIEKVNDLFDNFTSFLNADNFSKEYMNFNWAQNQGRDRLLKERVLVSYDFSQVGEYVSNDYIALQVLLNDSILDGFSLIPDKYVISTINYLVNRYPEEVLNDDNVRSSINRYFVSLYETGKNKSINKKLLEKSLSGYRELIDTRTKAK